MKQMERTVDFLIVCASAHLDWSALIDTIAPKGRLHQVGIALQPMSINLRPQLMQWQRSISGSSTGSPTVLNSLLDFSSRHKITPQVEHFSMSKVNEAIAKLRNGKVRYRIILDADFS